jgi:membrane-associated phospholipid phosphatase
MERRLLAVFFVITLPLCMAFGGSATDSDRLKSVGLFANMSGNIQKSFSGSNSLLQLAGAASTVLLIHVNADYQVNRYFHGHGATSNFFSPVVMTGMFLTPAIGAVCYFEGKHRSDPELKGLGSALLQAQIITTVYMGVLKGITGRPHPDPESGEDMKKLSRTFRFGFLRGGLFWGWPSGHTASTMALVSTLTAYYPEKTWIKVGGAALLGYTILGVSAVGGGHMHWFSDAVAASLMTYAIGHTVGDYYRRQVFPNGSSANPGKIQVSAEPRSTCPVIRIVYAF